MAFHKRSERPLAGLSPGDSSLTGSAKEFLFSAEDIQISIPSGLEEVKVRERLLRAGIWGERKPGFGVVILGDGAVWIWNIADREFPGAIQIVDLYHAREHLWNLAGKRFANDIGRKRWAEQMKAILDAGRIEDLAQVLRSFPAPRSDLTETLRSEADYFESNAERMRYPELSLDFSCGRLPMSSSAVLRIPC